VFEKSFRVSVLTINKVAFEGDVVSITTPGSMGSFSVLAGHAPLVSSLERGILKLRYLDNREEFITISGGFIEVNKKGEVIILADSAEKTSHSKSPRMTVSSPD
jgi:F-type H+-transporting ATPase subunit epsilon